MTRAIIIAGGPSFVLEDALHAYGCGLMIAVNSSIFSVPFADVQFAGDHTWYDVHSRFLDWLPKDKRFTTSSEAHKWGATQLRRQKGHGIGGPYVEGGSSGHKAISAAYSYFGATRIVLLGYDCQFTGGLRHHHGDHPERLNGKAGCANPQQTDTWAAHHLTLAEDARKKGVEIVNCSRATALECYERKPLLDALHGR